MHAQLNRFQFHINNIPAALYALGLRDVVISPGSRNAPLIMAFSRFGKFRCLSSLDERSAGFVALGIAKQTGRPCAAICTSGSAVANYYPAVLEAFYMQIPLLVISADRPTEMIDRWDGQTIHQSNLFFPHIKASFQYPVFQASDNSDALTDICSDFYKSAISGVKGPAHLNVPMDEPLYDAVNDNFDYPEIKAESNHLDPISNPIVIDKELIESIQSSNKILYIIGAENVGKEALAELRTLSLKIPVLADVLSNNRIQQPLSNWESALINLNQNDIADFMPEVLISSGKMLLNKKLKQLLRKHTPKLHIHLEPNGYCADTFFSQPKVIRLTPKSFFESVSFPSVNIEYHNQWALLCSNRIEKEKHFNWNEWSELTAIRQVIERLDNVVLHLANSMTIRNVAYLAQYLNESVEVHCNRGVSGIDGCTSTALGMALSDSEKSHVLITGDLAFLYDNNAFLINELPTNFKVIVMNNEGGGIFTMIDGPASMRELNPFMTTPHQRNLKQLADLHVIKHISAGNMEELNTGLNTLLSEPGIAILEILTNQFKNTQIFNQFKH